MNSRITVTVHGLDDPSLVAEIEQTVRESFHALLLPGTWRVTVRPSRVSGGWDFTVHGLDVRHSLSIAVPPHLLSTLIPRRMRESLHRFLDNREEQTRSSEFPRAV